jgi:glycine oxidase
LSVEVVVVGGGVIGCAVARSLAREGARVTVVDRGQPCGQASWAAAGMLAPQGEADRANPFLDLLLRSRDLFPALVEELRAETGIDVGYRTEGTIHVAACESEEARLKARFAWQRAAGLPVEALDVEDALRLEPALDPRIRCALFFPRDHQVDNRLLCRALEISAESAGVRFLTDSPARSLLLDGIAGVVLESGERLESDVVVLAAGAWSGTIGGLPRPIPVTPVHGQMIGLRLSPPLLRHVVGSGEGYLVPRADGRLIVGTTVERTGFRLAVTAGSVHRMLATALRTVPGLADQVIESEWSGLRPGTPDNLPILGFDPSAPRLIHATGHYRNGILLAPVTAEIVAALVAGREPGIDFAPFSADRF